MAWALIAHHASSNHLARTKCYPRNPAMNISRKSINESKDWRLDHVQGKPTRVSNSQTSAPRKYSTKIISSHVYARSAKAAQFSDNIKTDKSTSINPNPNDAVRSAAADKALQRPQKELHIDGKEALRTGRRAHSTFTARKFGKASYAVGQNGGWAVMPRTNDETAAVEE